MFYLEHHRNWYDYLRCYNCRSWPPWRVVSIYCLWYSCQSVCLTSACLVIVDHYYDGDTPARTRESVRFTCSTVPIRPCLSVYLSVCLSVCLSACLVIVDHYYDGDTPARTRESVRFTCSTVPIRPCLSVYLSVCLSVCLSACLVIVDHYYDGDTPARTRESVRFTCSTVPYRPWTGKVPGCTCRWPLPWRLWTEGIPIPLQCIVGSI